MTGLVTLPQLNFIGSPVITHIPNMASWKNPPNIPSELSLPMARPRGFPVLAQATSTCGMRCGCHGRDSPDHTRAVHRAAHGYPEKRPRSRAPGDASGASGLVWDLHLQCKHIYPNLSVYLSICPSVHLSIYSSIYPSIHPSAIYPCISLSKEV